MSYKINRRGFIKTSGALLLSGAISQEFSPMQAIAAPENDEIVNSVVRHLSALANNEPSDIIVVGEITQHFTSVGPMSSNQIITHNNPLSGWAVELAKAVAISFISGSAVEWVKYQLAKRDDAKVNQANQKMRKAGYTDHSRTTVYGNQQFNFYSVGHRDKLNACLPIFPGNARAGLGNPTILEGPAIIGLCKAAQEWRNRYITPANALIPLSMRRNSGQTTRFENNMTKPFIANTNEGVVGLLYETHRRNKRGQITVVSVDSNNRRVFNDSYGIRWG